MGVFRFLRDAGKKVFDTSGSTTRGASAPTAAAPARADAGTRAGDAIERYIRTHNIDAQGLQIDYDGTNGTATVRGTAKDQATREMIVLLTGNVQGVEKVDDQLGVAGASEPPAQFYTVEKGDTLSKIAKQHYGDANRYPAVFEANRPMLKDPDEIFPGQVLRIPRSPSQAAA